MQISVIIPTYNRSNFLKRAIDSVLSQNYPASEIIVVDDGSTDDTLSFLNEYESRIRPIFLDTNSGVSHARNLGIAEARYTYIAFLDSDDYWLPEKLQRQTDFHHDNPQYKISYTDESWLYNGRHKKKKSHHTKPSGNIFVPSLSHTLIGPSSVLIHRSVFDEVGVFDETLPVCEDYDLWLRITQHYSVGLIDEELIIKTAGHEGQLSFTYPIMDQYRIQAMEKQLASSHPYRYELLNVLLEKCRIVMEGAKKRNQLQTYAYFLKKYEQYVKLIQLENPRPKNESN